jgi:hypothetical protein
MKDVLSINGAELYADGQNIRYNVPNTGELEDWEDATRRVNFGIAYPTDDVGKHSEWNQKMEARAKAIAALPELLELAEYVLKVLPVSSPSPYRFKAEKALKKAGAI